MILANKVKDIDTIKNDIITCHSVLVEKLNSKGVEANKTEKLPILIDKINNITLESLGGRKYASGVAYSSSSKRSFNKSSTATVSCYYFTIKDLEFNPSYIICNAYDRLRLMNYTSLLDVGTNLPDYLVPTVKTAYNSSSDYILADERVYYSDNIIFLPAHTSFVNDSNVSIRWIAFE